MRILLVVHQFPPERIGGTEIYTLALAKALARHNHQVAVFHRAPGTPELAHTQLEGVSVYRASAGSMDRRSVFQSTFRHPGLDRAFDKALADFQPDLVHVQHLMGFPVSLADSISHRELPLVITLHDYWWICPNAQLLTNYSQQVCDGPQMHLNCARCVLARAGYPRLWIAIPPVMGLLAWRRRQLVRILGAASQIIAPTDFVGRWYVKQGTPADRLVVIPHGLERQDVAKQEKGPSDVVRFAYIGGLSWQKGIHVLVDAFARVRGKAELWIAGDESGAPAYVADLRARATPAVRFLGKLTREEVWQTLARVDVVVVPSLWYETFSLIISEAFAAGVPVIASRLGPLAERVRDGVDGLLVQPGDVEAWSEALQSLVDEPDLLAELRANVRAPLTQERHVGRVESVYRRVVDEYG